jgi:hypothetical protein
MVHVKKFLRSWLTRFRLFVDGRVDAMDPNSRVFVWRDVFALIFILACAGALIAF